MREKCIKYSSYLEDCLFADVISFILFLKQYFSISFLLEIPEYIMLLLKFNSIFCVKIYAHKFEWGSG